MTKNTITIALALSAAFSMPAFAGPNWAAIHRAEAQAAHEKADTVRPLDFGPRALTTPWVNKEQALAQEDAQKKVAASHADKNGPAVAAHSHGNHGSHS